MTFTFAKVGNRQRVGSRSRVIGDLAISSYTLSGEALVPGDVGLNSRIDAIAFLNPISTTGQLMSWVASEQKVHAKVAGGLVTEIFPDVLGGIFANDTSDGASATLNDAVVMALADANATTAGSLAHAAGKTSGLTNPNTLDGGIYAGRNVVVSQKADAGGTTFTAANIIITGTAPDGTAQTETIAIQTGAVAASNWRTTVGTKAFATVTNVRLTAAQPAGSTISVGIGTIFGLRSPITAEADIVAVQKGTAAVAAATYIGTASPSQIDMGADIADDVDILVSYNSPAGEATAATSVGTVRIEAIGV